MCCNSLYSLLLTDNSKGETSFSMNDLNEFFNGESNLEIVSRLLGSRDSLTADDHSLIDEVSIINFAEEEKVSDTPFDDERNEITGKCEPKAMDNETFDCSTRELSLYGILTAMEIYLKKVQKENFFRFRRNVDCRENVAVEVFYNFQFRTEKFSEEDLFGSPSKLPAENRKPVACFCGKKENDTFNWNCFDFNRMFFFLIITIF